jgi:hypothetical protein
MINDKNDDEDDVVHAKNYTSMVLYKGGAIYETELLIITCLNQ